MQVIVTTYLDELLLLLQRASELATLHQRKDSTFTQSLLTWLTDAELILTRNKRPQVGEMAGIRAQIQSSLLGVYDKTFFQITDTSNTRKIHLAVAGVLLNHAQRVLLSQHEQYSTARLEAEKVLRHMVLISLQKNSFYAVWNSDSLLSGKLVALWQSFSADPDLVQGTRQILSLVSYPDALRLLDEVTSSLHL